MEASDSDEEAPKAGYEVHISEAARARASRMSSSKEGIQRRESMPTKRRGSLSARLRGSKEEP